VGWRCSPTLLRARLRAPIFTKACGIDPYRYLHWLFRHIHLAQSVDDYDALLPVENACHLALTQTGLVCESSRSPHRSEGRHQWIAYDLPALKSRRFRIGDTALEATGDCHPCSRMGETFGKGRFVDSKTDALC
jgi:hypothetical protein